MIKKGNWVIITEILIKVHPYIQLNPLGVVTNNDRRKLIISYYSYLLVNYGMINMVPLENINFEKAIKRLLQQINDEKPRHG